MCGEGERRESSDESAGPEMSRSVSSPPREESAEPDRRGGQRQPKIQPCFYQLSRIAGRDIIEFSDGHALSLNASQGGLLLLMPRPPERRQVFEVQTPASGEGRGVTLVETCWTRELTFGDRGKVYLVGVRSLFEPTRAC
jgi:hypothetical protein